MGQKVNALRLEKKNFRLYLISSRSRLLRITVTKQHLASSGLEGVYVCVLI